MKKSKKEQKNSKIQKPQDNEKVKRETQREFQKEIQNEIKDGEIILGLEFGPSQITAILTGPDNSPLESGIHNWESSFINGIWTYDIEEIHTGLTEAYANLKEKVFKNYGIKITRLKAIGISAMMHGYLVFDKNNRLLVPFRSWRNTLTRQASKELTDLFNFTLPERWSVAHLYQAILNGEKHVSQIDFLTTLAGYAHWKLCGQKVTGLCDASGIFPLNAEGTFYDPKMASDFNANQKVHDSLKKDIIQILPKPLKAGECGGHLTKEGAMWLDPEGDLKEGIFLCPPEGDAGTGMAAANSVLPGTGNILSGNSIFGTVILEKPLYKAYPGIIDILNTPEGKVAAMVHANNCMAEYNKWLGLFEQISEMGSTQDTKPEGQIQPGSQRQVLNKKLLEEVRTADKDCGGIYDLNYISGESITDFDKGRPFIIRLPNAKFTIGNFMRSQLYSAVATLRIGMNRLFEENVHINSMIGQGELFSDGITGYEITAAAMNTPIYKLESPGQGGAWGMALLASYAVNSGNADTDLGTWLDNHVFKNSKKKTYEPQKDDLDGFNKYMANFKRLLEIEKSALKVEFI